MGDLVSFATVIDGKALWETAVAAVIAGVGVTAVASTAIYGFATFVEARNDERALAAAAAAVLALVATLAFAGAIAVGLIVMIKG